MLIPISITKDPFMHVETTKAKLVIKKEYEMTRPIIRADDSLMKVKEFLSNLVSKPMQGVGKSISMPTPKDLDSKHRNESRHTLRKEFDFEKDSGKAQHAIESTERSPFLNSTLPIVREIRNAESSPTPMLSEIQEGDSNEEDDDNEYSDNDNDNNSGDGGGGGDGGDDDVRDDNDSKSNTRVALSSSPPQSICSYTSSVRLPIVHSANTQIAARRKRLKELKFKSMLNDLSVKGENDDTHSIYSTEKQNSISSRSHVPLLGQDTSMVLQAQRQNELLQRKIRLKDKLIEEQMKMIESLSTQVEDLSRKSEHKGIPQVIHVTPRKNRSYSSNGPRKSRSINSTSESQWDTKRPFSALTAFDVGL